MTIFLKGIIIGICALLPGISGSVIAISLGIYEKTIESISSFKNIKFLLILFLGLITGIYLTAIFLINIISNNNIFYYIIVGIILSEIPLISKKIKKRTHKRIEIIPFILAFSISTFLCTFNHSIINSASCINYFIGGILFSFGKIFPGVSSSFFLLSLGIYEDIIIIILNPLLLIKNIKIYFFFIIGTIIGIIFFSKLLKTLLNKKIRLTYSVIAGLILSSVSLLIPKLDFIGSLITSITIIIFLLYRKKKDLD